MEWSWQRLGPGPWTLVVLEEQAVSQQLLSCGCTSNGASRASQALKPTLGALLVQFLKTLLDSVLVHAWPLQAPLPSQAKWGLSSCRGQRAELDQQRERKKNQTSPARTPFTVFVVTWEPGALTLPEPPIGKKVSPAQ